MRKNRPASRIARRDDGYDEDGTEWRAERENGTNRNETPDETQERDGERDD